MQIMCNNWQVISFLKILSCKLGLHFAYNIIQVLFQI